MVFQCLSASNIKVLEIIFLKFIIRFCCIQMVTNPKNTITGFRNLLGRGFSDPIAVDEVRNVPFTVEERKDNTIGFKVSKYINRHI